MRTMRINQPNVCDCKYVKKNLSESASYIHVTGKKCVRKAHITLSAGFPRALECALRGDFWMDD